MLLRACGRVLTSRSSQQCFLSIPRRKCSRVLSVVRRPLQCEPWWRILREGRQGWARAVRSVAWLGAPCTAVSQWQVFQRMASVYEKQNKCATRDFTMACFGKSQG